jgi:hypothetical protein
MCSISPPPSIIFLLWPWQEPAGYLLFAGFVALALAGGVFAIRMYKNGKLKPFGRILVVAWAITLVAASVCGLIAATLHFLIVAPAEARLWSWYYGQYGHLIAEGCDPSPLFEVFNHAYEPLRNLTSITMIFSFSFVFTAFALVFSVLSASRGVLASMARDKVTRDAGLPSTN